MRRASPYRARGRKKKGRQKKAAIKRAEERPLARTIEEDRRRIQRRKTARTMKIEDHIQEDDGW